MHIIDKRYPLVENNGFLPETFNCSEYLMRLSSYKLLGGVVVSASFQAFDQSYLEAALKTLGAPFVGVTQLPASVSDNEIIRLNDLGVRAIRFNLKRGGSEVVSRLSYMAHRVYEIANWHVELYIDSKELHDLSKTLKGLPAVSIDHLGLSKSGLRSLFQLVENGVKVKATGFGRVDFEVASVLKELYLLNPEALMFGTDLPSTRSPRPYSQDDFILVADTLGDLAATQVFSVNAINFYRPVMS